MRFYVLDDLVSPATGRELMIDGASTTSRAAPAVERCKRWCGFHNSTPDAASENDCHRCANTWIEEGALTDGEHRYKIAGGIPRFVTEGEATLDADTQESFGYEWQHFDSVLPDYDEEVHNYFRIVPPNLIHDAIVLDAGCGMARWARHIAKQQVRRLYAVDFSRAIESAARNLADCPQAHCIQADVCSLPFRQEGIDFTYSLGVLHHLEDPDAGMRSLARVTRGPLLVYLYYALDNRPRFYHWILSVVTIVRKATSRLPKPLMHRLSWVIAIILYWPLARSARLAERLGFSALAEQIPLCHYRNYALRFMVGDAFDRFATPIEKRYSRADITSWLARYGREVRFSDHTPFWVSLGVPKK
jgi:SAM-dependent methyltransferase